VTGVRDDRDPRPKVLSVDDEPAVLDGLRRQLHQHFRVVGYTAGPEALEALSEDDSFKVIISDMRMPTMDGATLRTRARAIRPDTVRILLSGQSDLEDAAAAINEGHIFRFLIKPCPRPLLERALADAVEYNRLLTAERVLLEQTLTGSVAALLDTLALANPTAFARANRIRRVVAEIVGVCGLADGWRVEIAAALSQIGSVVLSYSTLEKLHSGLPLTSDEQAEIATLPAIAVRLLDRIPRLGDVVDIIASHSASFVELRQGSSAETSKAAGILRLAVDLDYLQAGGFSRLDAIALLASRRGTYDPELLFKLTSGASNEPVTQPVIAVEVQQLRPGMVVAADVTDISGRLLVGRGHEVSERLIELIRNRRATCPVVEPIHVTAGQQSVRSDVDTSNRVVI
jgi:response regulator RpfG family c-di-GMP phosphodiesterase